MAARAPSYIVPISNGIFAHCQRMGIAVWVFMWLVDHVTKEEPSVGGHTEGLVYGGRALRTQEIARDLGSLNRTVQRHLDMLVAHGYLRRLQPTKGLASGYAVLKSKKWNRLAAGVCESGSEVVRGNCDKNDAGATNLAGGATKMSLGATNLSSIYKEDNTHNTLQEDVPSALSGSAPSDPFRESKEPQEVSTVKEKVAGKRPSELALDECWIYYREKLKKSATYDFSKQRRAMGEAGLKACVRLAKEQGSETPLEHAVELLKLAVDRLATSEFHNGKNGSHTKYLDWEVLFRGKDKPCPQKLTEYWLDDSRWA